MWRDFVPIRSICTHRISQSVSKSVTTEQIKLFVTAIKTPPYDLLGLSLRYTLNPSADLIISLELMVEFSHVSVPMMTYPA